MVLQTGTDEQHGHNTSTTWTSQVHAKDFGNKSGDCKLRLKSLSKFGRRCKSETGQLVLTTRLIFLPRSMSAL